MACTYYANEAGEVLVCAAFETTGAIRMGDRRCHYTMAGSTKKMRKSDALAFIESAKQVERPW